MNVYIRLWIFASNPASGIIAVRFCCEKQSDIHTVQVLNNCAYQIMREVGWVVAVGVSGRESDNRFEIASLSDFNNRAERITRIERSMTSSSDLIHLHIGFFVGAVPSTPSIRPERRISESGHRYVVGSCGCLVRVAGGVPSLRCAAVLCCAIFLSIDQKANVTFPPDHAAFLIQNHAAKSIDQILQLINCIIEPRNVMVLIRGYV